MKLNATEFLEGLAASLQRGGARPDVFSALRERLDEADAAEARAEHAERTANELAAEVARLNDVLTTQRDALRSVRRALAAWETQLPDV